MFNYIYQFILLYYTHKYKTKWVEHDCSGMYHPQHANKITRNAAINGWKDFTKKPWGFNQPIQRGQIKTIYQLQAISALTTSRVPWLTLSAGRNQIVNSYSWTSFSWWFRVTKHGTQPPSASWPCSNYHNSAWQRDLNDIEWP